MKKCIDCGRILSKDIYTRCKPCNGRVRKNNKVTKICPICKKEFKVWPCYIKRGKGIFCSKKCRAKNQYIENNNFKVANRKIVFNQKGSNNHQWKGGITPEWRRLRTLGKFMKWKRAVKSRDYGICQKCNQTHISMVAHHINSFNNHPKLRTKVDNGITFCKDCHKDFHHIYGFNNNRKQLDEFLGNKQWLKNY